MRARRRSSLIATMLVITLALAGTPSARAFDPLKPFCKAAQLGSGALGKACGLVTSPGRLLKAGGKLATGHVGGAAKALAGDSSSDGSTSAKLGLAAVVAWVLGGATFALHETGQLLGRTTTPQLRSTWFSSAYWRMAAIAALLTVPFLCAAAVQAVISGDLALLGAALGYLPLAFVAVGIAAPVVMLLLAASDQLSAAVGAAGSSGIHTAVQWGGVIAVLAGLAKASPFVAFLIGALAAGGALVLWLELLMREAAVYIVVMMLPLAFAALVWPARRTWALRAVELLIALILAKFAIVAVLALGGAALGHIGGISTLIGGVALILLGAFAPWALLRLVPFTEIAAGTAGALRQAARLPIGVSAHDGDVHLDGQPSEWATLLTAAMSEQADDALRPGRGRGEPPVAPGRSLLVAPPTEEDERVVASAVNEPSPEGQVVGSPVDEHYLAVREHGGYEAAPTQPLDPVSEEASERSPGLGPMWQAADLSWTPLALGLEQGWPPRVWPPDEDDPLRALEHDSLPSEPPEGEL